MHRQQRTSKIHSSKSFDNGKAILLSNDLDKSINHFRNHYTNNQYQEQLMAEKNQFNNKLPSPLSRKLVLIDNEQLDNKSFNTSQSAKLNRNSNNHIVFEDTSSSSSSSTSSSSSSSTNYSNKQQQSSPSCRGMKKLSKLVKNMDFDKSLLTNEEVVQLVKKQYISIYQLENFLGKQNSDRCVDIRREFYRSELAELDKMSSDGVSDRAQAFDEFQDEKLDYKLVNGACCENVIGHVKIPVGIAGPLILDKQKVYVPLATTEGCLVASICRGLSALRKSGGVFSFIRKDSMTRAPIIRFEDASLEDSLKNVERAIAWLNDKNNKKKMRAAFNSTTSHGKLIKYTIHAIGREIHIRFEAETGDAMGMNMCSKGVECALKEMRRAFPTMKIVTLSGNMCTDKKPSAINWIQGRGKSVECNADIPSNIVEQVFKVSVDSLIDTWSSKVMVGSALAGSIGGFNCQAANILSAIFIATGQDPAQNVTSSNCMLLLRKDSNGSLVVTCSMPSIECGTVGGGTILADQSRYLQMMGIKGSTRPRNEPEPETQNETITNNGDRCDEDRSVRGNGPLLARLTNPPNVGYTNAKKLAKIICATVMAGELSLLAALTDGSLVKSHMRHNRSASNLKPVCQPF